LEWPGGRAADLIDVWATTMATTKPVAAKDRARNGLRVVEPEIVIDDVLDHIPAGTYQAVGGRGRLVRIFNTDKLLVPFIVMVPDPDAEHGHRRVRVFRAYNVRRTSDGHFIAGRASDFLRESAIALGRRVRRRERPGTGVFDRVLFSVVVRTVTRDHRQHRLHVNNEYSAIDCIIDRLAGGSSA
jgi:hypothetical protein